MKLKKLLGVAFAAGCILSSCQNDLSPIGSSLVTGEVTIVADSLEMNIPSKSVYYDQFDSRTMTKLLGRINVPEYGRLSCSFVSQMLSASSMPIPDSISVNSLDSVRIIFSVPRGSFTGDSLAPQQLKVYELTKPLPSDISSTFDPAGYYDNASLMGAQSYTLSNIAKGDSAMKNSAFIRVPVKLDLDKWGKRIFNMYRDNNPVFQWPSTFNAFFPGIYVEQNFGNGCVSNISKAEIFTYWHYPKLVYTQAADSTYKYVQQTMRDSVCLMASQPEVISSNIIRYDVSDDIQRLVDAGHPVITTPGGYMTEIIFPAQQLLDQYHRHGTTMQMVSSLRFEIPATTIPNSHGLSVAPYLLMIRKAELEDFFVKNKIPDGTTSFYAAYDTTTGSYQFTAMRDYFLSLLSDEAEGKQIDEEDMEFCLVPVDVTTETVSGYASSTVYVTRCTPYQLKPTMTQLFTDRALVSFTYSAQRID